MDLRSKLNVSSSWEESASLQHVLYITSSSGVILDQPHEKEKVVVTLSQYTACETQSLPCYLHIKQLTALRGYSLMGVEFQSGSRNVEVYDKEDYVTTCRGSLVEESSPESKMYDWHLDLSSGHPCYDCLTLKLLSLQGSRCAVDVSRLTILLTEDHGGKEASFSCCSGSKRSVAGGQPLQELLDSFPTLATNTPPFLSSLVSSLKFYQASKEATAILPESRSQLLPPEIAHMVSAFQELRPAEAEVLTPAYKDNCDPLRDGEGSDKEDKGKVESVDSDLLEDRCTAVLTLASVECLLNDRMMELETRLKSYVDAKFNEMMDCINRGSELEDLREHKTADRNTVTINSDEMCLSDHNQDNTL